MGKEVDLAAVAMTYPDLAKLIRRKGKTGSLSRGARWFNRCSIGFTRCFIVAVCCLLCFYELFNFIEFGLPAQIYGVGFLILMVFGHKKIIIMGFLVCVFATKNFRLRRQHQ